MPKVNEKSVIAMHFAKRAVKDIAMKHNVRVGTIYYILRKNDIPVIDRPEMEEDFIKQLVEESSRGISLSRLSLKYKLDKTRLCKVINSYSISDTIKQAILNLKKQRFRHSKIAQRLSITTDVVKKVLREYNVAYRLKTAGLSKLEIKNLREE